MSSSTVDRTHAQNARTECTRRTSEQNAHTEGEALTRSPKLQLTAVALLVLYAAGVAYVVFWPTPVDSKSDVLRIIATLHDYGLPRSIGYPQIEFFGNVAMFVPLGVLLGLTMGPHWWWLAVLACIGFSTSIEVLQYLFLPERFATYRDVVANSFGGALGTIVAGAVYSARRWRTPPRSPSAFDRVG